MKLAAHSFFRHPVKATRGFTLIELMIGMTIGAFISAALTQLYFDFTRAYLQFKWTNDIHTRALFFHSLFGDHLRYAGDYNTGDNALTIIDRASSNLNGRGKITLTLFRETETQRDCLGVEREGAVRNTFTIKKGVTGIPGLYCNNHELIAGVDNLSIEFGIDNNQDHIVDSYQTLNHLDDEARLINAKVKAEILPLNKKANQLSPFPINFTIAFRNHHAY